MARAPLNALRAFEALARLGSHQTAATELGVTVSALSHQIRKLEASLATSLLVANGRRIQFTPSGVDLAAALGPAFETIRASLTSVGRFRPFRLAICPLFASILVAERWDAIETTFGERVELALTPTPRLSTQSNVDASLLLLVDSKTPQDAEIIHQVSLIPLATPRIRDLLHNGGAVRWIVCEQWRRGPYVWGAHANVDIQPADFLLADGLSSVHTACMMGAGVAILPKELSQHELRHNRLAPVYPGKAELRGCFALLHRSADLGAERAKRLARVLRQNARLCLERS